MSDPAVSDSWSQVMSALEEDSRVTPRQMGHVYLASPQGLIGNTLLLAVPNETTRETLQGPQVSGALTDALNSVFGHEVLLAISIDSSLNVPTPPRTPDAEASRAPLPAEDLDVDARRPAAERTRHHEHSSTGRHGQGEQHSEATGPSSSSEHRREAVREDQGEDRPAIGAGAPTPGPPSTSSETSRLNERYHFESFVIGSSNRFAHAAANAVAEAPAKAYNPLFIYGESGLGKTHLLHAIGHYARRLYPGLRVRYVNSEEFTNDFINSIRHDEGASFKQVYRNVDILLIDDIQFLADKEATVEEFFHTFNTLYNNNKQVVITSDLPPKQLSGFEERLRSRFEWGLITDIQPPDLETRIAILRKKAEAEGLFAPPEVLEYIASRISTNIRELEGALIRVTAFASLNRQDVDIQLAEHVLKDLITDDDVHEITPELILHATGEYFNLTMDELTSKSRTRTLVTARQIAMYLLRELTEMSLPKIGQVLGGRDHTTVIHADRKIRELMAERRTIYNQVTELTNEIKRKQRGH